MSKSNQSVHGFWIRTVNKQKEWITMTKTFWNEPRSTIKLLCTGNLRKTSDIHFQLCLNFGPSSENFESSLGHLRKPLNHHQKPLEDYGSTSEDLVSPSETLRMLWIILERFHAILGRHCVIIGCFLVCIGRPRVAFRIIGCLRLILNIATHVQSVMISVHCSEVISYMY